MKRMVVALFVFVMTAASLAAGEKKLMHCFAFTTIDSASSADWDAFKKATDQLTKQVPGLSKVWYGKLRNPLRGQSPRTFGVCMEFKDEAALKSYVDHAAHKEWQAAYEKVRQPGTTTFDILGE